MWFLASPALGLARSVFLQGHTPATRARRHVVWSLRLGTAEKFTQCQHALTHRVSLGMLECKWSVTRSLGRFLMTTLRHPHIGSRTTNLLIFHPLVCTNLCGQYVVLPWQGPSDILELEARALSQAMRRICGDAASMNTHHIFLCDNNVDRFSAMAWRFLVQKKEGSRHLQCRQESVSMCAKI